MRVAHHRYTFQQYLALDQVSNVKLEYSEGEIYAMAGGTPEHAALAMAAGSELVRQLEGRPCRAYSSDLRVRVLATGLGTYPDVTIVCGQPERDPEDKNTVINPTVLVEILSDATEAYDRGGKFDSYRQIPSLQEYVLISHRERLIEVFRRGPGGEWSRSEARSRASARLESIGGELDVDRVYAGIELDTSG
ncbi:MAG TPA: Uma2 family endonuclease [Polyangia bacterium]|jgi:Uma2 family endonuclease